MIYSTHAQFSRRRFLSTAWLAAVACSTLFTARASAKDEKNDGGVVPTWRKGAANAKIQAQAVRGGVHVLMGSGGNIGVLAGMDGLLLVDSGLAGSQPQI